jgi:hypothetical protein
MLKTTTNGCNRPPSSPPQTTPTCMRSTGGGVAETRHRYPDSVRTGDHPMRRPSRAAVHVPHTALEPTTGQGWPHRLASLRGRRRTRRPKSRCSQTIRRQTWLGRVALAPHQSLRTHTSLGQPSSTLIARSRSQSHDGCSRVPHLRHRPCAIAFSSRSSSPWSSNTF